MRSENMSKGLLTAYHITPEPVVKALATGLEH